jgi:hypothetical protein
MLGHCATLSMAVMLATVQAQDQCAGGEFLDSGTCMTCPEGTYDAVPDETTTTEAKACLLDAFVQPDCTVSIALDLPLLGDTTERQQGNDAQLAGGAIATICDGTCGLILDGDGDRATVPHFDYADDGSYTYSFWMTKETCTGNSWEYIYSHNKHGGSIAASDNSGINTFLSCGNGYIRSGAH